MGDIRSYLLRLTAASLICGIAVSLVKKKGIPGTTVKMISGLFMAMTVLAPLVRVSTAGFDSFLPDIRYHTQSAVADGKNAAQEAWIQGIKASAETYILNKAEVYEAKLEVSVNVEGSDPPSLSGVQLRGSVSPYAKRMIMAAISMELGISEEDQQWIG